MKIIGVIASEAKQSSMAWANARFLDCRGASRLAMTLPTTGQLKRFQA